MGLKVYIFQSTKGEYHSLLDKEQHHLKSLVNYSQTVVYTNLLLTHLHRYSLFLSIFSPVDGRQVWAVNGP